MRSRAALGLVMMVALLGTLQAGDGFRLALPGYRFEFPRDHFAHPDFQTEWWYYTGNLRDASGRRFGFELTFFRQALSPRPPEGSAWSVRDVYLAHFALSDTESGRFQHEERLNRAGPGIAGASEAESRVWNGNWSAQWNGNRQHLVGVADGFEIDLELESQKPPVVHGANGVSQKGEGPGKASHYISLTRLATRGSIKTGSQRYSVSGTAWMDHEFFTHQLEPGQVGWDWLSLQLVDGTEMMLFRLRRADARSDPFSSGTYIDREGRTATLGASEFALEPVGQTWTSPDTHASYPLRWRVRVAGRAARAGMPAVPPMQFEVSTPLQAQEIVSRSAFTPSYWEGAIDASGSKDGRAMSGVGYLEMTGYDKAVKLGETPPTPGAASRQ